MIILRLDTLTLMSVLVLSMLTIMSADAAQLQKRSVQAVRVAPSQTPRAVIVRPRARTFESYRPSSTLGSTQRLYDKTGRFRRGR